MDQEVQVAALLKEKKLRVTPTRITILELFNKNQHALAHSDLEAMTEQGFDRITVYRTLKTFVDHGILHEVIDDEMKVKYSMCSEACSPGAHHDNHLHFKCEECERTYCLTSTHFPKFETPINYRVHSVHVLISGLCEHCV
ncbi:MAG: transcriptional repressor [Saprospiraceae bacterium]|nr:MAG: transcriptional repressor [Saprospiraceae bacterium]